MKKLLIAMIIAVCFIGVFATNEKSKVYTRQAAIDNINGNLITFCDECGNMWEWEEDIGKPYTIDEKVVLCMDDMDTETIYDDVIIAIK